MPLHDHFNPPLTPLEQWQAFHHAWATVLAFDLNARLPRGYRAQPSLHFGVEFDVSAQRRSNSPAAESGFDPGAPDGSLAVAAALDSAEVHVHSTVEGLVLVGVIELVSPSNKDRPAEREAFVDKCAALLHRRVGLLIVDIVTARRANLHRALAERLDAAAEPLFDADLYAASYRPQPADSAAAVAYWARPLALGHPLPTMPFWLRDLCVGVDLEATYQRTWDGLQMGPPPAANGAA